MEHVVVGVRLHYFLLGSSDLGLSFGVHFLYFFSTEILHFGGWSILHSELIELFIFSISGWELGGGVVIEVLEGVVGVDG